MGLAARSARDFWVGVLGGGGVSAIPRWSVNSTPGVAEHQVLVPESLMAGLARLAGELGITLSAVLVSAHAKVLAAVCGESEVSTGYVVAGGMALPCRIRLGDESWGVLLREVARVESELLLHQGFPVEQLRGELGVTEALFETVVDSAGFTAGEGLSGDGGHGHLDGHGDLDEGISLWLGVSRRRGQVVLRLRYRCDVLDAPAAARFGSYHVSALSLIAGDVDAVHHRLSLLDEVERHFQLDGLAGPRRELPARRVHELFEARVAAHPDAIAAVHGSRQWSYRELNARANRVGRALLARGLRREGVVAVVSERTLDWMAAVLAVFKAGGVYLPIEPGFPPDRIASTLSRAGCGLVLTEPGRAATLKQAVESLPAVRTVFFDTAYEEDHADGDLGVEVAPEQLAYIYFTSGSTGEPKGAMCEHGGMLNHLYAKIDDLGIGQGCVVAQTAPQCFDISLWQLVSALLVGGRTLLVEQQVILDVARFVDRIDTGGVGVVQVVPSYLEAVLSFLEQHPRRLPRLRCVSVTGEALKKELVARWFAAQPGITLVNAYGLTETSDDTNHAVMHRVTDGERVPLGPPISNVCVYIVDDHLEPVPLGAPGEIVFSGVCVGRGYVNDPERTAAAFVADPHKAGQRLYRSGDYGRWAAGGTGFTVEFLGRRDTQVKIRGFRIEIGEIENTLLRIPGVRDGAVVVAHGRDGARHLVGFCCGPVPVEELRRRLAESLPEYMIPAVLHWCEDLPLTANGKIDRKALVTLAARIAETVEDRQVPATPTEQWLAGAWARVLGVPVAQIGRWDDFFDRGGTSLSAVKLAIALERAVSLKDLTTHPVLAELAGVLDEKSACSRGPLGGAEALTPSW